MKNFVVGAQLYSIRKFMQSEPYIDATFKAIRAMGYTTCQLSGQNTKIPYQFYADKLQEHGLKCVVTHNSLKDFEENFDELVARHHAWNCRYAGLGAMPAEYHEDAEGFKCFALKANEIGKKLKDHGIVFVYHNHAFEFTRYDGTLGMDVLFDNFGDNGASGRLPSRLPNTSPPMQAPSATSQRLPQLLTQPRAMASFLVMKFTGSSQNACRYSATSSRL